jgi:hypothetical protein
VDRLDEGEHVGHESHVHRIRDLGEGRTLAFERDLHGDVTGAYVSHDASGRVCLTRITIGSVDRPGNARTYRLVTIDPVTVEGPPIRCGCGTSGRIRVGRWTPEPGPGGSPATS